MKAILVLVLVGLGGGDAMADREPSPTRTVPKPGPTAQAKAVKVTILSTTLSGGPGRGIGEWGFAALIEVDGKRWLVDTGARPETVLRNATELKIDLAGVTDVVLTHAHDDHTGGLIALRTELRKRDPRALGRAHVGTDFFATRVVHGTDRSAGALKQAFAGLGGVFVEHAAPAELAPGVWFTGPVPRKHPERNWSGSAQIRRASGLVEDNVPEDSSIVIETAQGLIVVTGCGHAGIANIVEYARRMRGGAKVHAVIGGMHLFQNTADQLAWTGRQLRPAGVAHLLGAHCTGSEAVLRLRDALGLTRATAAVAVVGASFTLGSGFDPLALAR
jgi:7,8-dihydropterin-6-yl-methyl-4-(beta-D-ribofuranosyl)aminobenzene 5'-phosphate synthase